MDNNVKLNVYLKGLVQFLKWWRSELLSMLPRSVIDFFAQGRSIELSVNNEGVIGLDTQFINDEPARVYVDVAQSEILRRELVLPYAAIENLREVLSFEMDRQTPFHADQVFFDYRINRQIEDKTTGQKTLSIDLCLVPKNIIDSIFSQLRDWSLQFDKAVIQTAADNTVNGFQLRLVPGDHQSVLPGFKSPLPLYIGLGLFLLMLILPFWQQDRAIDILDERLETVKQRTIEARALQERLDLQVTKGRYLLEQKIRKPSALQIINELSAVLPDTTWLRRLEIKQQQLHIQGVSASASSLIGILEKSSLFTNARFSSPITQDRTASRESFQIIAQIQIKERL